MHWYLSFFEFIFATIRFAERENSKKIEKMSNFLWSQTGWRVIKPIYISYRNLCRNTFGFNKNQTYTCSEVAVTAQAWFSTMSLHTKRKQTSHFWENFVAFDIWAHVKHLLRLRARFDWALDNDDWGCSRRAIAWADGGRCRDNVRDLMLIFISLSTRSTR